MEDNYKYIGKYYNHANDFIYKSYKVRKREIKQQKNQRLLEIDQGITTPERFYVYAYLDPRHKGEYHYGSFKFDYAPFYIGKGQYDRLYAHMYYNTSQVTESLKFNTIERIKQNMDMYPIILKVAENITEDTAFEIENYLIKSIGRINVNTGILTNKVSGHKSKWENRKATL